MMSRYRIPFILFAGIVSTILILLSCGQDSGRATSTQTDETQRLTKQLQQSGVTIENLQQQNQQLRKELLLVTKELVRVKVERDILKLELGPNRNKNGTPKSDQTYKP